MQALDQKDLVDLKKLCFDGDKMIDYVLVFKDIPAKVLERTNYLINLENAGLVLKLHV